MDCAICRCKEESDNHIFLECPTAVWVWELSGVAEKFWVGEFRSMRDCMELAMKGMERVDFGEFIAILSKCWAARNVFIFQAREIGPSSVSKKAIAQVKCFREVKEKTGGNGGTEL